MIPVRLPSPIPIFFPVVLWLLAGPPYIAYLKHKMFGQFIREDGPQHHQKKAGTPTMGGLMILATVLASLVGMVIANHWLLTMRLGLALLVLLVFGALGFSDDWLKITKRQNKGLSGWSKLAVQIVVSGAVGIWVMLQPGGSQLYGVHHGALNLGWFYPVFAVLVITGASNAYNLADGLDGLAGGTGFMTFIGLAAILGVTCPELALFSILLAGGCLGFLVFNRNPAKIFMGDTGSLALGGIMGATAVLGKIELLLLLLGGVYVIETLSVMLQVGWFKWTKGKRLFKMSPLHHHFELCGWSETAVVITFVLFQALLTILTVGWVSKS